MTEIPPEMEFDRELTGFETEEKPRRFESRYVYEWEKVAERALTPDDRYSFTCCGTVYRATNAADISLMRQTHTVVRHGG